MNDLICVFDVETTNKYVTDSERVVEVAMALLDFNGNVVDELDTIVNPQRDVGPTHIHGLTASDVMHAPTFEEIAGDVAHFLKRATLLAAHNVSFDERFITHELNRCGVEIPPLPTVCTMREFDGHKLQVACEKQGVSPEGKWHCAMTDVKAASELVRILLDEDADYLAALANRNDAKWPEIPEPTGKRFTRNCSAEKQAGPPSYLSRILRNVHHDSEGQDADVLAYLTLIESVLEDRLVEDHEEELLVESAKSFGLSREQVEHAHRSFLDNLIVAAIADGHVSEAESADLTKVSRLLGIPTDKLDATLSAAVGRLSGLVASPAEPATDAELEGKAFYITGSLVCTMQGETVTKPMAEALAAKAGMVAMPRVTKKVDILITADANTQSGSMTKAKKYGIRVLSEHVFWSKIGVAVD